MSDIVARLEALSHCEHDDLSVGREAADEITKLRQLLADAHAMICDGQKAADDLKDWADGSEDLIAGHREWLTDA